MLTAFTITYSIPENKTTGYTETVMAMDAADARQEFEKSADRLGYVIGSIRRATPQEASGIVGNNPHGPR